MTPVRLLESRVIDQIAAGEVVERPASVVKELVENALDAGARSIDVTLKDGGRTLVRVADDGAGMGRQDAMLAIERHATSKIRDVEDLASVRTLGFRGEALPSIAAVSRFELVTRPRDDDAGTRIRIDAGVLTDVRTVGAAPGTVVEVRTLFHTLPARKAFLRSAGTELGHAVEVVTRAALVRPDVAFVLRHEDRVLVRAQGGTTLATRATTLLGLDATIPVEVGRGELHLVGVAAGPTVHRPSIGTAVYLYVGGRWVRDPLLRRAVAAAYRDLIPPGRHPVVVLDLRVPDGAVDVNVHPTKAEVRFRDPAGIAVFVGDGLRDAIRSDPRRAGAHRATDPGSPILPFQVEVPAPPTPRIAALPPELAADRMG
ncbi:MAG: DNA mismatch repair endonuclease MutL, partial [Myxococcota bacterium]